MKSGTYYLFHIFNADNQLKLNATRAAEEHEVEQIKEASRHVERYFSSQNVFHCVFANRNDALTSMVEMARNYFDRGGDHPEGLMQYANLEVSRKFANTCSLFRSFLDHFDRYFKHSHGKTSHAYAAWKDAQSNEYDRSLSYRIVYMMRNYIQHYDMPPLHVSIHESRHEEGIITRFNIDIAALRKDDEIRKRLEKSGDININEVPLLQTLDEWSECVNRIAEVALRYRLEDALPFARQILDIRQGLQIGDEGGIAPIWLPAVEDEPDQLSLSIALLPEAKAKHIAEKAQHYKEN